MLLRISRDDIVIHANRAMADYLKTRKDVLAGCPLDAIFPRTNGEIRTCLESLDTMNSSSLLTDASGRVFEVRTYVEGETRDILLDEVTGAESVGRSLLPFVGVPFEDLEQEELKSARQPDRRTITALHSRLRSASLANLPPVDLRIIVNTFCEEAAEAVMETGGTATPLFGVAVGGVFGAPRVFSDHALRAVRSACQLASKMASLRENFHAHGKPMPRAVCGLWTGESTVGAFGAHGAWGYSSFGLPQEMAEVLGRLARPGEVLAHEDVLHQVVHNLPEGWQAMQASSEEEPDLSDLSWSGLEIVSLPEELRKTIWLVGPEVESQPENAEFYFQYIWALQGTDGRPPTPILRVFRPSNIGDPLAGLERSGPKKQPEQVLGKYRVIQEIGAGGMGKVWKARDMFGNTVAIKVLHDNSPATAADIKRFQREAEVMARLPHRNICRIIEMSAFEGLNFIVMEYVDGISLSELLHKFLRAKANPRKSTASSLATAILAIRQMDSSRDLSADLKSNPRATRTLPLRDSIEMMIKVCAAVQFAHEHGVLHRDLKPGNILLREDGEPLVADFGLAKVATEDGGQSISLSGHVVGTLQNMAPEQAQSSKDVDARADIYSLGTILYQMLTAEKHFKTTGNLVADIQALQIHEPRPVRTLNPEVGRDLEIIVHKCLRKVPQERYRSVADLRADLESNLQGEPIKARPLTLWNHAWRLIVRHRLVASLVAVFLLILTAGTIYSIFAVTSQIVRTTKALEVAEQEREKARIALAEAEKSRNEAQNALAQVQEERDRAEKALKNSQEAVRARLEAEGLSGDATQAAKASQKRQLEMEQELAVVQESLENSKKQAQAFEGKISELQGKLEEAEARPMAPKFDPASLAVAKTFADEAQTYFTRNLTGRNLIDTRTNDTADLFRHVSEVQRNLARALFEDPHYAPAWMLKGRLHLACLEIPKAREAFQKAIDAPANRTAIGKPLPSDPENPEPFLKLCDELQKPSKDRFDDILDGLGKIKNSDESSLSAIVSRFKRYPSSFDLTTSLSQTKNGRTPQLEEELLNVLLANGGEGMIRMTKNPKTLVPEELVISGIPKVNDLSLQAFHKLPFLKIKFEGVQEVDWVNLSKLPRLQTIDLSGCPISTIPPGMPFMNRILNLNLANSQVSNLDFIKAFSGIQSLDLSNTSITDLSPLTSCRNLSQLEISGLSPQKLPDPWISSLKGITLSPEKLSPEVISLFKRISRPPMFREPGNTEFKASATFWKSIESRQPDN